MGNHYCVHCGTPLHHYTNKKHASRNSCRFSHDKFHTFKSESMIILSLYSNKIKNSITECLKKKINRYRNNEVHIEMSNL